MLVYLLVSSFWLLYMGGYTWYLMLSIQEEIPLDLILDALIGCYSMLLIPRGGNRHVEMSVIADLDLEPFVFTYSQLLLPGVLIFYHCRYKYPHSGRL